MTTERKENIIVTAAKDVFAGSVGGVAQCLTGHPFDTVKVRLQTQTDGKYRGMIHCFRCIIKEEGPAAIFKGVQSPLTGLAFMNAALFFSYERAKKFVGSDEHGQLSIPKYFLAGLLTGFAVSFIESPVDLFKCQLQVRYKEYRGFFDCAAKISKKHGIRGVYQGLGATMLRDSPANALYFGFYEWTKKLLCKPGQSTNELEAWKVLSAGAAGGVAYWGVTYPADVIKSTMQADTTIRKDRTYPTILSTAKKLYRQHGARAFFKGFTPCMVRSVPANAVTFFGYEQARKFIDRVF
jgi:solute carrier family 25 carnitine/acylcarnitine transporter 20/29